MSSSKIVMVMAMLILVFLFAGVVLSFVLQSENVLEEQSGRVVINEQAELSQMAAHVALRAYNCNDEGGGQFSMSDSFDWAPYVDGFKFWHTWRKYYEYADTTGTSLPTTHDRYLTFKDLEEETPGKLQCSGTSSTLPFQDKTLIQGAGNYLGDSHWGNDQEGRYGRMEFKLNETIWIGRSGADYRGCWGVEMPNSGTPLTEFMIGIGDHNDYNFMQLNKDLSGSSCHNIGNPDSISDLSSNGAQKGALLTMNVLYDDVKSEISGQENGYSVTVNGGTGTVDYHAFQLCEGATGYIQGNTGGQNAALGDHDSAAEVDSQGYSIDNPPGRHGEQVGGTAKKANNVRLFMVVRGGGDC